MKLKLFGEFETLNASILDMQIQEEYRFKIQVSYLILIYNMNFTHNQLINLNYVQREILQVE